MYKSYAHRFLETNKFWTMLVTMAVFIWSLGLPALFPLVQADAATYYSYASDLLSTSASSTLANHTVKFDTATALASAASTTITMQFTAGATGSGTWTFPSAFGAQDMDMSTSSNTNGTFAGLRLFNTVSNGGNGCANTGQTAFEVTSTSSATITLTHCNGTDALAASSSVKFLIGTNISAGKPGTAPRNPANQITNPGSNGDYEIILGGTGGDTGDIEVAVVNQTTLTASVESNLTFTVSAVANGTTIDTSTTNAASTGTTLPFPELSTTTPSNVAQDLALITNARNGYSVVVYENQDPTSVKYPEAKIAPFNAGSSITTTATAWATSSPVITNRLTWGHWGVHANNTNDQATPKFTSGDTWSAVASSTAGTSLMYGTTVADGLTLGKGESKVVYRILVRDLQEAATDYTNTLTYVVTPIF